MTEISKELFINILNDLSGKTPEGERNSNMSVLLGHVENKELVKENYSDDSIINATAKYILDPITPQFINLTIESEDSMVITMLWAKYRNFKDRLVNKEQAIMQFNALGTAPYINEDNKEDTPVYMAISLTNPIMAYTGKSNLSLPTDDTISFLIPLDNVVIESVVEEELVKEEADLDLE